MVPLLDKLMNSSTSRLICPKCGPIAKALFDGGQVEDRIFEDVLFDVTTSPSGDIEVTTRPEDQDYMEEYNETMWLRRMREYISKYGTDADMACSKCGEPITVQPAS